MAPYFALPAPSWLLIQDTILNGGVSKQYMHLRVTFSASKGACSQTYLQCTWWSNGMSGMESNMCTIGGIVDYLIDKGATNNTLEQE